jgi:hypothetical protein
MKGTQSAFFAAVGGKTQWMDPFYACLDCFSVGCQDLNGLGSKLGEGHGVGVDFRRPAGLK